MNNNKRIAWLDYARVFAIMCVILIHTLERICHLTSGSPVLESFFPHLIILSVFTLGRMGVPVFFFLTGYLLLDRSFTTESTAAFYRQKFGGLLITTEIWVILYYFFSVIYHQKSFSLVTLVKNILFLKNFSMSHLWYMPVILGIYLFIPFLSSALGHMETRMLYLPFSLAFVYLFIVPVCNVFLTANSLSALSPLFNFSFAGGVYGFCVILGYFVKKGSFNRISSTVLIFLGCFCFGLTVFSQYYSSEHDIRYFVWYNSGTLVIACLCVFILFSRCHLKSRQWISALSRDSFGIYLFHSGLNMVIIRCMYFIKIPSVIKLIIVFFLTLAISWAVVHFLAKERHLRRYLFFQK